VALDPTAAMNGRRFPLPWSVEDIGGCFAVKASNGWPLIFVITGKVSAADPSRGY
jgi:hypothetical protein